MSIRLVLIGLLIAVGYFLIRNYLRRPSVRKDSVTNAPADTVKCEVCGTHVLKTVSVQRDGHYFCSEAHSHENTKS